jgi:GTP cyclohydrolase I
MSQNFTARATDKSFLQIPTPTEKAPMTEQGFNKQVWHRLLVSLGVDPNRAGLVETSSRVAKAWKQWTSGYAKDPAECLKIFKDGAHDYNERLQV